jgi:hypothetical protein
MTYVTNWQLRLPILLADGVQLHFRLQVYTTLTDQWYMALRKSTRAR